MTLDATCAWPRLLCLPPESSHTLADHSAFPRVRLCQEFRQEGPIGANKNPRESQAYQTLREWEGHWNNNKRNQNSYLIFGLVILWLCQPVIWKKSHLCHANPLGRGSPSPGILLVKRGAVFQMSQAASGSAFSAPPLWMQPQRVLSVITTSAERAGHRGLAQHSGGGHTRVWGLRQLSFCLVWTCLRLSLSDMLISLLV